MLVFLEGGGWCYLVSKQKGLNLSSLQVFLSILRDCSSTRGPGYDQSCSPTDEGTLTDCQKRSYKNLGSSGLLSKDGRLDKFMAGKGQ